MNSITNLPKTLKFSGVKLILITSCWKAHSLLDEVLIIRNLKNLLQMVRN
jgi:hypothetical protein